MTSGSAAGEDLTIHSRSTRDPLIFDLDCTKCRIGEKARTSIYANMGLKSVITRIDSSAPAV